MKKGTIPLDNASSDFCFYRLDAFPSAIALLLDRFDVVERFAGTQRHTGDGVVRYDYVDAGFSPGAACPAHIPGFHRRSARYPGR